MSSSVKSKQMKRAGNKAETNIKSFIHEPLDIPCLALILLLLGIGLITMFSASYAVAYEETGNSMNYFIRQGIFAIIGIIGMMALSYFNYEKYHILAIPALLGSVFLLLLVPFIGITRNQATRWLSLGFTDFQPSELAKLAVILSFSSLATIQGQKMKKFKYGIAPYMAVLGLMAALLFLEPHLSATIIIMLTGIAIIFVGGANLWHLMGLAALGVTGGAVFILSKPYAMTRIKLWLDPFIDAQDKGWQAVQSFLAIGSGGFWGLGLGQSRQKHLFLPEPANDFVFSVICEELGFVGAVLILIVFAALIIRGYWIAMKAPDRFGCLLAIGITTQLAIQTIVNICVVSGLMPVTGASLPFFSYGGTSLIIQLAEMGILLNISRQIPAPKKG